LEIKLIFLPDSSLIRRREKAMKSFLFLIFAFFLMESCSVPLNLLVLEKERVQIINLSSYDIKVDKRVLKGLNLGSLKIIFVDTYEEIPKNLKMGEGRNEVIYGKYMSLAFRSKRKAGSDGQPSQHRKRFYYIFLIMNNIKVMRGVKNPATFALGHEIGHHLIYTRRDTALLRKMERNLVKKKKAPQELLSLPPKELRELVANEFGYYFEKKFPDLVKVDFYKKPNRWLTAEKPSF
jgi:hypothetical protein